MSFQDSSPSPSTSPTNVSQLEYLSYPMQRVVGGFLRRVSAGPVESSDKRLSPSSSAANINAMSNDFSIFQPPQRTASPYTPPPLTPLSLKSTGSTIPILTRQLAEEIRLLVPTRLELVDSWSLIFSLERDGSSLSTLYSTISEYRGRRGGFVLVVKDGTGNVFGAYLNEPPRPSNGHYYGTGECFLWRCTILGPGSMWLPPPPSEDTTNAQRSTTIGMTSKKTHARNVRSEGRSGTSTPKSGASTPERIRFKAFPYSGINDYMLFCEQGFLSVGGG